MKIIKRILKCLSICETFSMYLSFHNRPLLDVDDNVSVSSSHHGHWKQQRRHRPQLLHVCQSVPELHSRRRTSRRHARIAVDAVRIAAELLQAVDGALAHHWLSTKGSVVDDLQHDGRRVHLLFGEKLGDTQHSKWNI